MARQKSRYRTDAELRLMEVLWESGSGTVAGVVESFPKETRPAYSSVLTILRILENKGYVRHAVEGRAFVYQPIVGREQAQKNVIEHILGRFFENSPELLALNLIDHRHMDAGALKRLRKRIEEKKR